MKLNKKYTRWIIEFTVILLIIISLRLWMQRDVVSGTAPNFNTVMLDGQYFDLYKNRNRPILIHFWATWCPVCKLEQKNIENISKDYSTITIAIQSGDDNELAQFMKKEKLSFKVINDQLSALGDIYRIKGVPVSFIVNKENKIEFIEVGYTTELGLRLRLWWANL